MVNHELLRIILPSSLYITLFDRDELVVQFDLVAVVSSLSVKVLLWRDTVAAGSFFGFGPLFFGPFDSDQS